MKKFLSLALALAMTLSLVVVGASATEYDKLTDKASIQHSEAVAVMNKLGIISGYSDGSFKPAASITRGAAAKIICMTKLGVSTANTLSSETAPFKDVSTANTFAAFIAYCSNTKVVNGYNDGSFRPSESVTGYAFAKMLLTSLGITGTYTGNGWEINVAAAAQKAKLFKGIDTAKVVMSKALSRDNACQMALNALNYSATSTDTYGVTVYTAAVAGSVAAADLTDTAKVTATTYSTFNTSNEAMSFFAVMNSQAKGYGDRAVGEIITVKYNDKISTSADSLLKTVFDVTRDTNSTDAYGRPSTTYTPSDSAWKLTFKATPVKTYTTAVTAGKLYSDLDGAVSSVAATVNNGTSGAKTATYALTAGGAAQLQYTGNGVTTEIYDISGSTTAYKAVVTAPAFGDVAVANVPASSAHGAKTTYTVAAGTGNIFSTVVDKAADVDTAVVTGTVANGDKVEYYYTGTTLRIQAVTTMEGVLTSKSSAGVYTIDGKSYEMAADADAALTPTIKTAKQTFYVGANGYILGAKAAASVTNYAAVLSTETTYAYNATTGYMTPAYLASVINTEGKVVKLPVLDETALTAVNALKGKLVKYVPVTDSKGVTTYTITAIGDSDFANTITAVVNKTNALSTPKMITTTATDGKVAYADANTLFVVANYDSTGVATGTVTTYTGIANVPSYSGLTKTYAVDTATVQDSVANVVFIMDDKSSTASDSYVYLTGGYTENASGYALNAIVNGKAATYTVSDLFSQTDNAELFASCAAGTYAAGTTYYKVSSGKFVVDTTITDNTAFGAAKATLYTMNIKGLYSAFTVASGAVTTATPAVAAPSATGIKVSSGLFYTTADNSTWTVNTPASIADATPVYTIHTVSGTCTASTASAVGTLTNAAAVYVNVSSGSIVSVFVTYAD